MNQAVNHKELGKRIALMRARKGLLQKELASQIGISRPSLAQMELGNRSISAIEIFHLAEILNFSIDEIMSADFENDLPVSYLKKTSFEKRQYEIPDVEESSAKYGNRDVNDESVIKGGELQASVNGNKNSNDDSTIT